MYQKSVSPQTLPVNACFSLEPPNHKVQILEPSIM
uniref:Uncharacterized protein n=1 Tax=Rhizophora mucronata TaxID=61149 RepID=A0A2P2PBF3_RHIMU